MAIERARPVLLPQYWKGCGRCVEYGYPITPSTEGAELMARLLPKLDGVFLQAVSEVAAINYMYGCAAAGLRSLTFTSSGSA